MDKKTIRHLFPGGNTTKGFHSFFDYILSQDEANHIYCIKGGPGVGKSSLMKKIGYQFLDLGFNVEFHHCSSDPDSLDGVVIPKLRVALLDGTAPHVVDPKNPGAVDEVLNLGEFWDQAKIKDNKDLIKEINRENGRLFNKAYKYLNAAGKLYENYENTSLIAFKKDNINLLVEEVISKIFNGIGISNRSGKVRHLFAYGITPKGILDYRGKMINEFKHKVVIKEDLFTTSEEIMNVISLEALKRGLNITCMHSPLKIDKVEDIIIDELSMIITVDNNYHKYEYDYDYEVDLSKYVDKSVQEHIQQEVNSDISDFEDMLYKAISYIKKAKENHDLLEKYYIEAMDFSQHEKLYKELVERISKFE